LIDNNNNTIICKVHWQQVQLSRKLQQLLGGWHWSDMYAVQSELT